MSAEQVVVLVLLVAAFVAGWFARGGRAADDDAPGEDAASSPDAPPTRVRPPAALADRPEPLHDAARATALAAAAYETVVDRWLDERDAITPAGRAAVGELEQAVHRLDRAAARLDEIDETLGDAAFDALEALRKAVKLVHAFREGRPLDAATSRELDGLEDEVARARATLEAAAD